MRIDEFRRAMAYASMKATEAEKREARRLAKAIIERNKALFDELAKL
jgi:uncharacterized protein (DUF305 family)